jgi:hypothetical protein
LLKTQNCLKVQGSNPSKEAYGWWLTWPLTLS